MSFNISKTTSIEDYKVAASFMASSLPWTKLDMNYDQCLLSFEGAFREVYVLKEHNEIKAFIIIQPLGTFKGYIQTLCVNPAYRGMGFGSALLTFAEKLIYNYASNIFICVSDFNMPALKLYQKMGFEVIGELKDFVKNGFTEILLRKTKGPMIS